MAALSPAEINIRLASTADYKSVVDINRNISEGFDYVASLFFYFQHHPDVLMFVAEIGDKIVSRVEWGNLMCYFSY